MKIKAVFFDLGSTLVYSKKTWQPIFERADKALLEDLHRSGIQADPVKLFPGSKGFIRGYYDGNIAGNTIERTTLRYLDTLLQQAGYGLVPAAQILSALKALYSVTQKNWFLEKDAIPTLKTLSSRGYQLGLISNTSDDNNVQAIIDRWGLRSHFKVILTSASLGIRKPETEIFQRALDHFQLSPAQAAMVGDTLEADILGANRMGMYSIWITRRIKLAVEGELAIQPQAVIRRLDQIPGLLDELEMDASSE